ncbi:MAG: 1-acyl-sn-glycerol-3-phosphate acyltransferase [Bacteroidales bacterium]|nr:1-acyl-sn-glycerol-3-phosphate acyltransferase [Bacteroidales bacterium]HHV39894.1 acyltransferase [Bacteroidales bacterium]
MITTFPENLRPFTDREIPAAMERIAHHKYFPAIAHLIFPDISPEEARKRMLLAVTIEDFQLEWMYAFNRRVIDQTIDNFTYTISPNIKHNTGYLFVSNHRDIILDSSLLQMVLVDSGFPTSMITYGDNLVINELAEDLARSNKMFKVVRQGNKRDLFNNSKILSQFMRTCVQQGHSCWIAQRNGRTKDGKDQTAQALVKMMAMSGNRKDPVKNYAELNIVPVAISYEYEPCDFLKTRELFMALQSDTPPVKQDGEDLLSIITGITQWKGNVHIHMGDPITAEELNQSPTKDDANGMAAHVCTLIDNSIAQGYKIYPTNRIAYDLLYKPDSNTTTYTQDEKAAFMEHLDKLRTGNVPLIPNTSLAAAIPFDKDFPGGHIEAAFQQQNQYLQKYFDVIKEIFLGIYANPLVH